MLKYAPILLLLCPAASTAAAPTATPAPNAAPKPATDPLEKVICRTEEGLGSRLNRKKVCMTVRQWKDQADDSRDAVDRIQQSQGVVPSG